VLEAKTEVAFHEPATQQTSTTVIPCLARQPQSERGIEKLGRQPIALLALERQGLERRSRGQQLI
jgi:hypothetical protein